MDEQVADAWIGLGGVLAAGVLTAIYTVGTRGALQRRVIKQEAEIANLLPPGHLRTRHWAIVEARLTIYRARSYPYTPQERSTACRRLLKVAGISLIIASIGMLIRTAAETNPWQWVGALFLWLGVVGVGAVGGRVFARLYREWSLRQKGDSYREARERMVGGADPNADQSDTAWIELPGRHQDSPPD